MIADQSGVAIVDKTNRNIWHKKDEQSLWSILAENVDLTHQYFGISRPNLRSVQLLYSLNDSIFGRDLYLGPNQKYPPIGKDHLLRKFPNRILGIKSWSSSKYLFLQFAEPGRMLDSSENDFGKPRILYGGIREVYVLDLEKPSANLIAIPSHGPLML